MNKTFAGLIGGLAGSVTTTVLHEILRRNCAEAPRLDKLGEEALDKAAVAINGTHVPEEKQYGASMTADLISNTLYYSAVAFKPKGAIITGTLLGATAGVGAVKLPKSLGLDETTTTATRKRRLLTIGLYTIGGLVAGLVAKKLTAGNGIS